MKIYETLQQQYQQYTNVQNIMKYFNVTELKDKFYSLKDNKASGIDKITKYDYEINLTSNINKLYGNLRNNTYEPKHIRGCYVPKPNGKLRPLGIPAFEDRIVQGVAADILYSIYDPLFLDSSFGYRLNRNCHKALSALRHIIEDGKTNYIVKTDIKRFL